MVQRDRGRRGPNQFHRPRGIECRAGTRADERDRHVADNGDEGDKERVLDKRCPAVTASKSVPDEWAANPLPITDQTYSDPP